MRERRDVWTLLLQVRQLNHSVRGAYSFARPLAEASLFRLESGEKTTLGCF
jgi:hypothetical protein